MPVAGTPASTSPHPLPLPWKTCSLGFQNRDLMPPNTARPSLWPLKDAANNVRYLPGREWLTGLCGRDTVLGHTRSSHKQLGRGNAGFQWLGALSIWLWAWGESRAGSGPRSVKGPSVRSAPRPPTWLWEAVLLRSSRPPRWSTLRPRLPKTQAGCWVLRKFWSAAQRGLENKKLKTRRDTHCSLVGQSTACHAVSEGSRAFPLWVLGSHEAISC